MEGFKMRIGGFFYLLLIIVGTSSCSVTKRLHSRGYHLEFKNRGKIDKSEDYTQKIKERDNSMDLDIVKEEHAASTQTYATLDALLFQDFKQTTEKTRENERLKKNTFQNQSVEKELGKTPIEVTKWMDYEMNETSQKVLKASQLKKAERAGGMITDGGMDWLVVILVAIGLGLVFGLTLGLLASSVQVFLVTAAASALVFILIYLLLWGLFSLMGL